MNVQQTEEDFPDKREGLPLNSGVATVPANIVLYEGNVVRPNSKTCVGVSVKAPVGRQAEAEIPSDIASMVQ